jgi:hypothetical protein
VNQQSFAPTLLLPIALAGALGAVLAAGPQPPVTAPAATQPVVSLAALTWLAGRWEGELQAGHAEEHWSEPRGGLMMGMFRLVNPAGRTVVLELETFRQIPSGDGLPGGAIELRFRHFNADLEPAEEKGATPTLRLAEAGPERFVFEDAYPDTPRPNTPRRLILTRTGPDEFRVQVDSMRDGKEVQIMDFQMRRMPEPATTQPSSTPIRTRSGSDR